MQEEKEATAALNRLVMQAQAGDSRLQSHSKEVWIFFQVQEGSHCTMPSLGDELQKKEEQGPGGRCRATVVTPCR
jgi:hypothetical protein